MSYKEKSENLVKVGREVKKQVNDRITSVDSEKFNMYYIPDGKGGYNDIYTGTASGEEIFYYYIVKDIDEYIKSQEKIYLK